MIHILNRIWNEEDGVLSFEWILLVTLLTTGVVSGITGVHDAINSEFNDVAQAMLALDQSYTIEFPLEVRVHDGLSSGGSDSSFEDAFIYEDCERFTDGPSQPESEDEDS